MAAASALQGCSSPLHDLRTRLHIELAKSNMDNGEMLVAREDAEQANALDYTVPSESAAAFHLERPWDRHLQPLLTTLRIRCAATHETPVAPLDLAALYIQRARECSHPATCSEYLHKAINALQPIPMVQPVYKPPAECTAGEEPPTDSMLPDERFTRAKQLTGLWACVLKAAWRVHLHDTVLLAAPYVEWFEWEPAIDHEMSLLQVLVSLWNSSWGLRLCTPTQCRPETCADVKHTNIWFRHDLADKGH
jgi:hypothetical protein